MFCIIAIHRFTTSFLVSVTLAANSAAATTPAPSVHQAVELGLLFLQKEAFRWKATRSCAACHHAATMLWTFNEARAHGYTVDEQALQEVAAWAFGDMKTNSLTDQAPPRNVVNLGWVYVLLSIETAPAFRAASTLDINSGPGNQLVPTDPAAILSARQTLVRQIVSKQAADGSWGRPLDERVPLGGPIEDIAILSRLALLQAGDNSPTVTDCIDKAQAWLTTHHDTTSRQGRNLRLLMNVYEGKRRSELNAAMTSIVADQNSDGGWSQTEEMPSDAYATGQALYVLVRAGARPDAPGIKRGVEFLVRTQGEEGSWPMVSRVHAKNLSPITAAGTAWAVLGLIRAS